MQKNVYLQQLFVHKNVSHIHLFVHKNVINMERLLYKELIQWKISANRKPLVLNGARQVGKTWLLTEFGRREYAKNVLFSLDRNKDARKVFQQGGSARQLIQRLSALSGIEITDGDTLLILDEIQDCPEALSALKYFCEETPQMHIAVAGSLLGISMHNNTSFPVGKVDVLRLYPLNFSEFVRAMGRDKMAEMLELGN